ncbi:MAG: rhomboid family intramembrane serine protease [Devosia nanyangense]|uniref:Rhomboid family intramembrane serine protease n=1 Tax=Devosia nanyangense TaxID=1228055 RepID=A0A933KY42_9HYPH|nr:rhomboid family intramembrane serine protease [Devosia nanyangense]
MSGDEKHEPDQRPASEPQRQPIFLLPLAVTALCGLLLAIQAADSLVLNDGGREALLTWFAFIPYRLIDPTNVEGGWLPLLWTPVTHAFLHAGWEHVLLNSVWLAIFATPVAQRYGATKMFVLFLAGAVMGALAFAATTLPAVQVLVGASGGIAALTGAAVRFVFQPPVVAVDPETGERRMLGRKLATLREMLAHPTARIFSLLWIVLNGIVPLLPLVLGGATVQIAWQAHLAGFFTGLLLVPLLERKHP